MSVRTLSRVWEHSSHSGTHLLMLLAIADFADDDGRAYPSVAGLARKCRMQPRNANYVLSELQRSGELRVLHNKGPKGTNLYQIALAPKGVQGGAGMQDLAGLQSSVATPAKACAKPLQAVADEPSLNRQEPKKREKRACSLPSDFGISNEVRRWAAERGLETFLELHLEHFVGTVKASGKKYLDWDQALMNYIRADYGDIRRKAQGSTGGGSIRAATVLSADEQFRGETA